MALLPDDEIQRRFEANLEAIEIDQDEAMRRWPNEEPRERERRRQLALRAAARYATVVDDETGQRLLGGKQPRKNKVDVISTIVELADGERQKEIVDAIFAPLASTESAAVRGKGAERIIRMKVEQAELQRRDREELRQLDKDDLIDRLAKGIMGSSMGVDLVKRLVASKVAPNGTPYDVDAVATSSDSAAPDDAAAPAAAASVEFA